MNASLVLVVVLVVSSGIIVVCALKIAILVARVRALQLEALTDPLTGAFNRRHLDRCLGLAIERRRRVGESACLAVFDIDRFKDINDLLGHAAGDAVLKAIVALFHRRARTLDLLFRSGGEEFALLLPSTDLEAALAVANRLRALIAASRLIFGHVMTVSVGVSELRDGQTPYGWLADADEALYAAKRAGRNQVSSANARSSPQRSSIESRVMDSIPLSRHEHANNYLGRQMGHEEDQEQERNRAEGIDNRSGRPQDPAMVGQPGEAQHRTEDQRECRGQLPEREPSSSSQG